MVAMMRNTKFRHTLLCLLCIVTVLSSVALASAISYTTDSYDVEITVSEDSSMHIVETIDVNFESPTHGIFRTIYKSREVYFEDEDGFQISEMVYQLKNFKCEGVEIKVDNSDSDYVELRMGSADIEITGPMTYKISYDVIMYVDDLENADHFYWNLAPSYWQNEIQQFTFKVNMPKPFNQEKVGIYAGSLGSADTSIVEWRVDGNTLNGRVTEPLPSFTGVTARIRLPEGYWVGVKDDSYKVMIAVGVQVLITALVVLLFFKRGKDDKIIKTVEFYPPDDMPPVELGYFYDGKVDNEDMTGMILWYAQNGYLKIVQTGEKSGLFRKTKPILELHKIKPLPKDAPAYSWALFNAIFDGRTVLKMEDIPEGFGDDYLEAKDMVKLYFKDNNQHITDPSSLKARGPALLMAMAIFAVMMIAEAFFNVSSTALVPLVGSTIICEIICFLCIVFMPKPSKFRTQLLGRILGFKDFIEYAEVDRINMLVEEDPEYFYNILPYAYIFGLTDKWIKNFDKLALQPPSWYEGGGAFDSFTPFYMAMAFDDSINSSLISALPTPSSSSFSGGGSDFSGGGGGGGFSGGGGGGGGGGAW